MPEETLLHKVHNELVEFRAETRQQHEHFRSRVDDHHETLYGDGNGVPGLRMRTDRLEQRVEHRDKHIWAIWTAVIGGSIAAFTNWFNRP